MTERSGFLWTLSLAIVGAVASPVLPSCSSSSEGSGFGSDDASSPSGSSSGGGDDGAAGSSSGSSSGLSSGGSSSGVEDAGSAYVPPTCGTPCDLRSNTCCLPADGGPDAAYCIKGSGSTCGTDVATLHCGSKADCTNGDLCCGDYDPRVADGGDGLPARRVRAGAVLQDEHRVPERCAMHGAVVLAGRQRAPLRAEERPPVQLRHAVSRNEAAATRRSEAKRGAARPVGGHDEATPSRP